MMNVPVVTPMFLLLLTQKQNNVLLDLVEMKPEKTPGWQTVNKKTFIPHDLESYPFYLKTSSLVGSKDEITIDLITAPAGRTHYLYMYTTVRLHRSSDSPSVLIEDCTDNRIPLNSSLE